MISAILLPAVLFSSPALGASPHPLVGTWKVEFPGGARIENGVATPIRLKGSLTVEARGDSLIANLVPDQGEGPARPPVRLAAKATAGDVTFVTHSQVTLNINGSEQKATSVATWVLRVNGERLEGTVDRKVEGMEAHAAGPQPITGTRASGG
jgi:hypothetical protein